MVTERALKQGDRVLFFTDGVIKQDRHGGAESGEERLRTLVERVLDLEVSVQETVRLLSRALMLERRGVTSDDATLLLLEWRDGTVEHLVSVEPTSQPG